MSPQRDIMREVTHHLKVWKVAIIIISAFITKGWMSPQWAMMMEVSQHLGHGTVPLLTSIQYFNVSVV